jgi:hypothetical protein
LPLRRILELEREFRVVTKQIATFYGAEDLVRLEKLRDEIATEAVEIARNLEIEEPSWCRPR